MQGPVYTMDMSEEGFVTGGKDGMAKLWDPDFKNITTVNLASAPGGYKGKSDDAWKYQHFVQCLHRFVAWQISWLVGLFFSTQ